jgi:putative transposase
MVRPLRLEAEGGVYHVIGRGNERKAIFRDDRDREAYLERLERYRERFGFRLYAFCLLDNHVHLALERGPVRLSRVMLALHGSYSQFFNRRHGRVGHLFQGRFKAFLVEKDRYLLALIRYIHENPVKAKIVERPELYLWSSDRFYRRGKGPEWLDLERVLAMLGRKRKAAVRAYRRLMGEPLEEPYEHLREIGQAVKGGEDFAIRAFRRAGEKPARRLGLTERQVAEVVAHALGFAVSQLQTSSRRRELAKARTLAAYLARREARIAVARMAKFFDRDESTLNRNVVRLEEEIASNSKLARLVEQLGKRLDNNTGTHG